MDAELISAYQKIPSEGFVNWDDLPATREFFVRMHHELTAGTPDSENVVKEDRSVPGPEGASEVPVRLYRPIGSSGALPGVLWIHGGGYEHGSVEEDDLVCQHVAEEVGCVVVSVEYRLAPEYPFPAPMEDCYAALEWMAGNAPTLGIDPARIAITGPSAGGGLTAGLALLALNFSLRPGCLAAPMPQARRVSRDAGGAAMPARHVGRLDTRPRTGGLASVPRRSGRTRLRSPTGLRRRPAVSAVRVVAPDRR